MKKSLLITTAFAAAFGASNAWAEDSAFYNVLNGETKTIEAKVYENYKASEANGGFSEHDKSFNGAVIRNAGTVTIESGATFQNNVAYNPEHETPTEQGGVIYSEGDDAKVVIGDDVTFQNNTAYAGAAIYLQKSELEIGDNVKFIGNKALCEGEKCTSTKHPSGGAIAIVSYKGGSNNVTIGDNAYFSGNEGVYGGAIKISQNVSVVKIGKNAVFENNKAFANGIEADNKDKALSDGQAGAIYNKGKLTIGEGAIFRNNHVLGEGISNKRGGAIRNGNGAELKLNGSLFENNSADVGGAIHNTSVLSFTGENVFRDNRNSEGKNDINNIDTGVINVSGTLELDGGISGDGQITFVDGSYLTVNTGVTTITNNVKNEGKTNLNLKLDNGFTGTYTMLSGTLTGDDFVVASNNLYNIEGERGVYEISKKSVDEVAAATGATGSQAAAAGAVTSGTSSNESFNEVSNNINELLQSSDASDVQAGLDALTALSPESAPMVQQNSVETTAQVMAAAGTRLTGGAISTGGEGASSGDNIFERAAMWVQGLFNKSKLDDTSDAKGFEADTNGLAFGFEKNVTDDVKVGIGYAYSQTDIDGFMRDTDVDTHTAILYSEYKPSSWYVNGVMTYGWSEYDENKSVTGSNVTAKYDVETFGLQAMTGYEMDYKGYTVIPEAGLRYVHIDQDGYTDSTGTSVSSSDSDILTGVIGAKAKKTWELDDGKSITPEVRVAATYDLMNDDVNSVVTLANGSSYSVEGDALDRFGMEFGAGVTAEISDNIEFSLGYEGKFREDYQDHTGLINAKYNF